MKCNETVISYYLILLNNNTIAFWSTGFDNDYEMYAPTKLLINEIVKYALKIIMILLILGVETIHTSSIGLMMYRLITIW